MSSKKALGLIAGTGELPRIVCDTARSRGLPVSAVAFDRETAENLASIADVAHVAIGQADKTVKWFRETGVKEVCIIGKIDKKAVFGKLGLDMRGIKVMKRAFDKKDSSLLLSIIEELESEGFKVAKQSDWVPDLLPSEGILGKKKPGKKLEADFRFGLETCRELAGRDIGQTVIIKDGVVLAVEAVEGTDKAIERGCKLGGKGAVMVKTSRPKQDFRFDIPTIGPGTAKLLARYKAAGLAIEANRTLVVDLKKTTAICDRAGIVFAAL